jgi:hypothetical protein
MSNLMNIIRIITVLLCISFGTFAQSQKVSFQLTNAGFGGLVTAIESQTDFRFYYNTKDTDTLSITYSAQNVELEKVLTEILVPKNFRFGFGQNKRIYITKEVPIIPFLKSVHDQVSKQTEVEVSISDYVENVEVDISIENRLFEIGNKEKPQRGEKTLSGYIKSLATGAPVSSATVSIIGKPSAVQTDQYGYFSINVIDERSTLLISSVGLKQTQRQLAMYSSGRLDVSMSEEVFSLGEVVVSGERGNQVKKTQMGLEKLSIRTIKQTPAVFGETDVISVILTLPGVQTVGEAASGFNVRGGATDQNLVLFGDATIYNSSHFFGLFSAFNSDAVSQVELYKSSIPARFGGRLSSVLDVTMKEGNRKKFSGSGGIGLLTGRLSLEGPIGKKTQVLVSGRSTYSDWLLRMIPNDTYKNSSANFYDANVQITHQASDKDDFYLTAYTSKDRFSFQNGITYGYENINVNAKWKRIINTNLYGTLTVGQDNYNFNIEDNSNLANSFDLKYAIRQSFAKIDLYHNVSDRHKLNYGIQSTLYKVRPGEILPLGGESNTRYDKLDAEQALESAIYISDSYTLNDKITIDAGIRYVLYNYLGPRAVNVYTPGVPKSEETILETIQYGSGKNIQTYNSPEFRIGARYAFSNYSSVKLGYNSLRQYIHMLSNTTSATPTDSWKLSDSHIKPQFGDQVSLGYYQNFPSRKIETSVEVYYKRMHDYLDYKSGARLLMNKTIETDVVGTEARAYGIELLAKKSTGKLNGWVSYTYSKVQQRTTSDDPAEMINEGRYYNSNFDKPHNLTFVGNYRFSHRYSFSLNSTYSTGRPITLPIAKYDYAGSERVYYSERNKYRIPDFFRIDAAINIEGNHKIKKLAHSSWTVGVYNLTGRKNPFSVYFVSEEGKLNGYKLSIFGHQIPFITYNFRF